MVKAGTDVISHCDPWLVRMVDDIVHGVVMTCNIGEYIIKCQ